MKIKTLACIGILALCATSCALKPIYIERIDKPDIGSSGPNKSEVHFNVIIKNDNAIGFRLVRSDLNVMVNNIQMGTIGMSKKMKVHANTSTAIPVTLKLDTDKLLSVGAMSLFSDPKVDIKGYVKGRKFLFTKKYQVQFQDTFSIQDFMGQ
ncbi:MAG TPA: LEA type 2 family protein [Cytophagales bacterium]|nr:LEA type 2 family protein [Cytophagales bacterium]